MLIPKSTLNESRSSRGAHRGLGAVMLVGLGIISGIGLVSYAQAQVAAKYQPTGLGCKSDFVLKIVNNVLTCERTAASRPKSVVSAIAPRCDRGTVVPAVGKDACPGAKISCASGELVADYSAATDMCVTFSSAIEYQAPSAI